MKIEYSGCVRQVEFENKLFAANIIIYNRQKGLSVQWTFCDGDSFDLAVGDGIEDFGEVTFYFESDDDREIFERVRFYLEDKDMIWILLPRSDVYDGA
jgi:hypothetical protein